VCENGVKGEEGVKHDFAYLEDIEYRKKRAERLLAKNSEAKRCAENREKQRKAGLCEVRYYVIKGWKKKINRSLE